MAIPPIPEEWTDGRSFLWALTNPQPDPDPSDQNNKVRERAFAAYPGDGMAVVTYDHDPVNTGHSVCMYDSGPGTRRIIAGSCSIPTHGICTDEWCKLPR